MTPKTLATFIVAILLVLLSYTSLYTVREGQEGILLYLGKIQVNKSTQQPVIKDPGLHFKLPLVQQVLLFDVRLQTLDIQSSRIVTQEKKDVIVDYYVKWKIMNPALYYTRTGGDADRAGTLLTQQLNDTLRAEFGRRTIREVVSDDRSSIMNSLKTQADNSAQRLGIQVVDVRIKRIDLPPEVSSAVYERMRAERERVATEHRAKGRAEGEAIRAKADANAAVIIATAQMQAAEARAAANANAGQIYTQAYSQNPAFYAFYRSLQAYQATFNNRNDVLVLQPNSEFFNYFNDPTGVTPFTAAPPSGKTSVNVKGQ